MAEGDKLPTRGGLRERRKQGIRDKEERHLLFFNEFTVKGSREVVPGGKMKLFFFFLNGRIGFFLTLTRVV